MTLNDGREAWADGCLFRRHGVVCRLPGAYGGIPPECVHCGWFPAEEKRRKLARGERHDREGRGER